MVIINASWGLGENVVQGTVTPDEYSIFKPLLDDRALKPIIAKVLGAKEKKMIYATGGTQVHQESGYAGMAAAAVRAQG